MMRRWTYGPLFLSALALLVSSVGCPNSRTISAGNGTLRLSVFNTNGDEWDNQAQVEMGRVSARPLDPLVNELLGEDSLALITDSIIISKDQRESDSLLVVSVSAGMYEITQIDLYNSATFWAENPDSNGCTVISSYNDVTLNDFPAPLTFTAQPDTDGLVTMTFNMSALAQAIFESFDPPVDPVYEGGLCYGTIDEDVLAAHVGDYLTVE